MSHRVGYTWVSSSNESHTNYGVDYRRVTYESRDWLQMVHTFEYNIFNFGSKLTHSGARHTLDTKNEYNFRPIKRE